MKVAKIDKIILFLGVVCAICGLILTISNISSNKEKEHTQYPLTTVVTEIDYKNDLVSVTDTNGFVWQFFGTEDWEEKDICSMIVDDNGTKTILDDVIIKVKYDGRTQTWINMN